MFYLRSQDQKILGLVEDVEVRYNKVTSKWQLMVNMQQFGQWEEEQRALLELDRVEAWMNDDQGVRVFQVGK